MRKGLSAKVFGRQTLLDLEVEHEEVGNILFPEANTYIDIPDVKKLMVYNTARDAGAINAKLFFERYLDELSQRGKKFYIFTTNYYWGTMLWCNILCTHLTSFLCFGTVESKDQECLGDLLQIWKGWPSLPTMGEKLNVAFLPRESHIVMLPVDYCFNSIKLPSVHENYDVFKRIMDTAIRYGKVGCGRF